MDAHPEVGARLDRLVQQLRETAGANLLGVALYGGLAKGRFTAGVSDINVLVVVADASLDNLLALAPPLIAALRDFRVVPFIVTPEDLRASARLFAGKIYDIQTSHRVLWGDVHLAGITVAPEALLLRARQETKNTELRLRLRALERGGDSGALWRGLIGSLPKLAVTFEILLRCRGFSVPADRPGLLRLGARELGLAEERIAPFAALHRTDPRPEDATVRRLYAGYLDLLREISRAMEAEAG